MALHRDAGNRAVTSLLGQSAGRPLDEGTREQMESKLGHDFADVRIHSGEEASKAAVSAGARAVTTGRDIVFGPGFYNPTSHEGKALLAHELAHVVQQNEQGGRSASSVEAESEAREAGASVAAGHAATVTSSANAPAQLQPLSEEEKRRLSGGTTPGFDLEKQRAALQRQIVFGGQGTAGPLAPQAQPMAEVPPPQKQPGEEGKKPDAVAEGAKKFADAAKRDPIVKGLRNWVSKVQPFVPEKDMKKALNDGMDAGLKEASKAGIKAGVEALSGKPTNEVTGGGPQLGPYPPITPQGEHIIKTPEFPIPDTPDPKPSFQFQYKGLRSSYSPGAAMDFKVVPPSDFANLPGPRLKVVAAADRDTIRPDTQYGEVHLDSPKPRSVELTAPTKPGKYVVRVDVGFGTDSSSEQEFEVTEAKKSQ
jgi:hypothetical protein